MKLFRTLFVFDLLGLLVLVWFFIEGLQYAYGGPDILWLPMLGVPAAALALALAWPFRGKGRIATILLGLLAVPFVLALGVTGLLLLLPPDFR